jgi:penicillin amidase
VDLVIVETDPDDSEIYRTPEGYRKLDRLTETIEVRDAEPQTFEIVSTIWGPIIDQDHNGRSRALRWIAHETDAVNLGLLALETVVTVEEAQAVANVSGIPPQNFVCVDENGSIGWTVMGRIPKRVGFDGRLPSSWADGTRYWDGWLEPEEYPRIVNPDRGAIWTANSRVTHRDDQAKIGDGGMDIGARSTQIRDGLSSLDQAVEVDMLAIQLDDRAIFLERWRQLLIALLNEEAVSNQPLRQRFRSLVEETWTGHASVDSVSYRLVRGFRNYTFERVYGWLTAPCREANEDFSVYSLGQWEGPLWKLVNDQPLHLLAPRHGSWNEALLSAVDDLIEYYEGERGGLSEDRTWGEMNTTSIRHPLSRAIPALSRWLDVPSKALPGDSNLPRVQGPGSGASERLAVSPGREEEGYLHMPVGQSGHPLSPYYQAGHEAWEQGRPTPFLPGPAEHTLRLFPR